MSRKILAPGTIISYRGLRATVLEDNGGSTIKVHSEGLDQEWIWDFEGYTCVIEKEPKHTDISNVKYFVGNDGERSTCIYFNQLDAFVSGQKYLDLFDETGALVTSMKFVQDEYTELF